MLKRLFSQWGGQRKIGGLRANTTNRALFRHFSSKGGPSGLPPSGERPAPATPDPAAEANTTKPNQEETSLLSSFFSRFACSRYAYDPANPHDVEFKRLCEARQWGSSEVTKRFSEYASALRAADLDRGTDTLVAKFFRKRGLEGFARDPAAGPPPEPHRLQATAGWGREENPTDIKREVLAAPSSTDSAEVTEIPTEHTPALKATGPDKGTGGPVANFFRTYEFSEFTYNPAAEPLAEFHRLQAARKWGDKRLTKIKTMFLAALGTKAAGSAKIAKSPTGHTPALKATGQGKGAGTPVANFFRTYEYSEFTHNPAAEPLAEFHRLQAARKWGDKRLAKIKEEFLAALGTKAAGSAKIAKSPAGHTPATRPVKGKGSGTPVANFFREYEFSEFTHNPVAEPLAEFRRLQAARKWGDKRLAKIKEEFLAALGTKAAGSARVTKKGPTKHTPAAPKATGPDKGKGAGTAVAKFFRKYQFEGFTHDPTAEPLAEFRRLQAARRWGGKRLTEIKKEFSVALGTEAVAPQSAALAVMGRLPVVDFLKRQQCDGYRYASGPPEREFKALKEAHKRNWEKIQEAFYKAVEEQFDLMLDSISGETTLRGDEVMVKLFVVGETPLPREEAETALKSVHVNIYDFQDLVLSVINSATESELQNLIPLLSPKARALNFPDDALLGIYSTFTGRVFPLNLAKESGTLVLLLRKIEKYFGPFEDVLKKFRKEGGKDLVAADSKGPHAVRELLLSRQWESLQAVRDLAPEAPPRP